MLFILISKLTDCDECNQFIHGPECTKHIFTIVADTVPKTRYGARYATKTLPAKMSIPRAGKGVFAKGDYQRTRNLGHIRVSELILRISMGWTLHICGR